MNIQVIKDEKKPLLKKRILTGRIGYEGKTPARLDIRKEIAKKLNAKEELVMVKKVQPDYGSQSAKFEVDIYDDEKALKAIEYNYMLIRHGQGEKKEEKKEGAEEEKK
jgi:small subunit ribosomal protein S24e